MKNKFINISIVDDDKLIIQLLCDFLKKKNFINISITATSGNELLEKLQNIKNETDVLLLDLRMKNGNGVETIKTLVKKHPKIKIIVLSSYYKSNSIGYMLKMGIHSFLPKEIDKDELITVINEVFEKGYYFNTEQIAILRNQINSKTPKQEVNSKNSLSKRELDVLELICQQFTAKEISEKLFISVKTVETHKSNLLLKTGVKNTAGLVIYAVQNKLICADNILLLD